MRILTGVSFITFSYNIYLAFISIIAQTNAP